GDRKADIGDGCESRAALPIEDAVEPRPRHVELAPKAFDYHHRISAHRPAPDLCYAASRPRRYLRSEPVWAAPSGNVRSRTGSAGGRSIHLAWRAVSASNPGFDAMALRPDAGSELRSSSPGYRDVWRPLAHRAPTRSRPTAPRTSLQHG